MNKQNGRIYLDDKLIGFSKRDKNIEYIKIISDDLDILKHIIKNIDTKYLLINEQLVRKIINEWRDKGNSFMITNGWVPNLKVKQLSFLKYIRNQTSVFESPLPTTWVHYNPEELLNLIQNEPNGFLANLLSHGRMIFESGRARTPLIILRQKPYLTIQLSDRALENVKLGKPTRVLENYILPVSRYAYSIQQGLYFESEDFQEALIKPSEYFGLCGTFYYFEPDSTVFLTFSTIEFYNNKIHAAYDLLQYFLNIKFNNIQEFIKIIDTLPRPFVIDSNQYKIIYDLVLAFRLFIYNSNRLGLYSDTWQNRLREILGDSTLSNDYLLDQLIRLSTGQFHELPFELDFIYKGDFIGDFLYAKEDFFDQPICNASDLLKIDIVVLTKMVGFHRIVIEILDTRAREVSLSSLAWLLT